MYKKDSTACLLVLALFALGACSSAPKPKTEIALSHSALQNAEVAGAENHAPIELRTAREKQALADAAMSRKNFTTAKQLAEQAAVDAEYAKAKTEADKSRQAVAEIEDSINMIRTELSRPADN